MVIPLLANQDSTPMLPTPKEVHSKKLHTD